MSPAFRSLVLSVLTSTFCAEQVREQARRDGAVRRQGKVDAYEFVMVVVLAICVRGPTAIAQLGQTFNEATGTVLARSSFWSRFNPGFSRLLKWMLEQLMADARQAPVRPGGALAAFSDVVAADASVMKVHDALRPVWKGTRRHSARAALKIHAWVRVLTGELLKCKVTPEAYGDSRAFGIDHGLRGTLMLFDRGYASPSLWRRIDSVGGYLLTRIPAGWNQTIVSENRRHRGRARRLVGLTLKEAFNGLSRALVDVNVEFSCRIRGYGGLKSRKVPHVFRVVAVRHPSTGEYSLYVTNAPPHMLAAKDIREVYRLRWEVETFFKALKSGSAGNEFPTTKRQIVEALLYAGLIRAALAMRTKAKHASLQGRRVNHGQWMRWWNRQLHAALFDQLATRGCEALSLDDLAIMLTDPNRKRRPTRYGFIESLCAA